MPLWSHMAATFGAASVTRGSRPLVMRVSAPPWLPPVTDSSFLLKSSRKCVGVSERDSKGDSSRPSPAAQRAVGAPRVDGAAVRREGDGVDLVRMTLVGVQRHAIGSAPEADAAV